MIPVILIGGGLVTLLFTVNALLSFADQGSTIASWLRLQAAGLALIGTGILLQIALLFR